MSDNWINCLPRKLLQLIFIYAFESPVLALNHREPKPAPKRLRLTATPGIEVCTLWKSVIESTPRLYVIRLLLGMPDGDADSRDCSPLHLSMYRHWLEQSKGSMLDIYFTDFWSTRDTTDYFDETMELIVPHAARWRILNASELSDYHTTQLLMHISNCSDLRALRCVALSRGTMSLGGLSAGKGMHILLNGASNFEQLQLKEVPLGWAYVPSFTNLRELEIANAQDGHSETWHSIFNILNKAPQLTEFKLDISQLSNGAGHPRDIPSDIVSSCPSLTRLELQMEFPCAVYFLSKVKLRSLKSLLLTAIRVSTDVSEIKWPIQNVPLPCLNTFTCRHVVISDITTFFSFFLCASLRRLSISLTVTSTDHNSNVSLHRGSSSLTLINRLTESTTKLITTFSDWSLKKSLIQPVDKNGPIIYGSSLPLLESLNLQAVFPGSIVDLLEDVEMPRLKELDISSYSPLETSAYDEAFRNRHIPKVHLTSLTDLKIDSLDQCCLLRHWRIHATNGTGSDDGKFVASPWRHLQIRDKHGNSRIHWAKFCSHHQDILPTIQALTLRVRAYWFSVPDPFAYFLGLRSLTLEFDNSSDGFFQSLLATHHRDWKEKMPLPELEVLYLNNCDLRSLLQLKVFIERRNTAAGRLKLLSFTPFPGNEEDATWLQQNVVQFDYVGTSRLKLRRLNSQL